jgi:hypothetical protein
MKYGRTDGEGVTSSSSSSSSSSSGSSSGDGSGGARRYVSPTLPGDGGTEASFVVVFDFDKTLAVKHVGPFDVSSSVEDRCFGGAARVQSLNDLFADIRGRGGEIHICTRNSSHLVEKSLGARCQRGFGPNLGGVGLLPSVSSIVGVECMDWETPKSSAIKSLARSTPPHRILFVDDDASNINEVESAIPGCGLLHVKGRGMDGDDIAFVRRWLAVEAEAEANEDEGGITTTATTPEAGVAAFR